MTLRFCCICCEDKDSSLFLVTPANTDGLSYWCDSCRIERYRELTEKNNYFGRYKDKLKGLPVPKLIRPSYRQEPRPKPPKVPGIKKPRKSYLPDGYVKPTKESTKPVKEPKVKSEKKRYIPKKKYIPEPVYLPPPQFTLSDW